jgi:hypothetical protein
VKTEVQVFVHAKDEDGKSSIPIYDPAGFDYRPVEKGKVVGCLTVCSAWRFRTPGGTFAQTAS